MEFDSQLLQDLLNFLRTLEGVSLPAKLDHLRGRLLGRVQTAISVANNYMEMQPGKPLNFIANDISEDYVPTDQQPQSPSSFLYQFKNKKPDDVDAKQPRPIIPLRLPPKPSILQSLDPLPVLPSTGQRVIQLPTIAPEEDPEVLQVVEEDDPVLEIYNNMSCAKAEGEAHYFGKLQRRGKWLVGWFENIRPFWAALVGHHFLTYDNKADQKPTQILSIKGCTCKPLDTSQRNIKKLAESTFELCFEEDGCYQFIASTPKEMEQWVAMIVRWESKAHNANNLNVPPPVPLISEEEPSSDDADSNDYYDDLVIDNIAETLATPVKILKKNASRSPVGKQKQPKSTPETKAKQASPNNPQVFNRVLPPPPSSTQNSEQEDEVYHVIDDHIKLSTSVNLSNKSGQKESSPSMKNEQETSDELYDDIETVKEEVRQFEANKTKRDMERNSPAREMADDDQATYDDVGVVKREVEQMKRNESAAKKLAQVENEKKTVPLPAVPAKPSPMKNFFGRFRHKSESPEKEGGKKKTPVSSPQQLIETQTRKDSRNPAETADGFVNNPRDSELSNYNSLPRPRPVRSEKSLPNDVVEDDGECIYDDVVNKKDVYNNHVIDLKSALEKRKGNDNSVHEASTKAQRNVVRNLNERFQGEIYQNQSGVGNVEDELEHYQVPRADANAHTLNSLEDDDDTEKIYDDVEIVAQKKREIERSQKQKPVVKTPPKFTRGPAVMAKPSANKLFNKFNKFPLSVSDKSPSEKNNQHRLITGKKPKTQEADIPTKKRQLMAADEEIYDDCMAK